MGVGLLQGKVLSVWLWRSHPKKKGNRVNCNLITTQSKVSTLKRRLKLCGAVLAPQLLHYIYELLK